MISIKSRQTPMMIVTTNHCVHVKVASKPIEVSSNFLQQKGSPGTGACYLRKAAASIYEAVDATDAAAVMIATKSAATRHAPPTRAPSMSG
jgi:hypothetical protein